MGNNQNSLLYADSHNYYPPSFLYNNFLPLQFISNVGKVLHQWGILPCAELLKEPLITLKQDRDR